MTVKDYLRQAFTISKLIRAKETRIQQLQDMRHNISSTLSFVSVKSSHRHDSMAEATSELIDLIEEYQQDIQRLIAIEREICGLISRVERDDYRLILYERYVCLKRWEDIAADNDYSWRNVHYLHSQALKEAEYCIELHTLDAV